MKTAIQTSTFMQSARPALRRPAAVAKTSLQCVAQQAPAPESDRRQALGRQLAVAAAALQLLALPAQAMWDGSSSAMGSCPLGDEGIECRKALLA